MRRLYLTLNIWNLKKSLSLYLSPSSSSSLSFSLLLSLFSLFFLLSLALSLYLWKLQVRKVHQSLITKYFLSKIQSFSFLVANLLYEVSPYAGNVLENTKYYWLLPTILPIATDLGICTNNFFSLLRFNIIIF